jgi:hypothetical protein
MCSSDHGDHTPALHIVAAELKLHSRGTEIGGHAPERITQAVGRLGPAHRATHGVADHGVKPGMQFCYCPGKALACQLGQRPVERGGLEREVACLGAIGLAGRQRLPWLHPQGLLACAHPQGEVRQPRRALELDLRKISESSHRRVKQGTQDPWLSLREFAPELRLVPPNLGRDTQKLDY